MLRECPKAYRVTLDRSATLGRIMERTRSELLRENAELHAQLEAVERTLRNHLVSNTRAPAGARTSTAPPKAVLKSQAAERKRMEAALRESEYRYRTLFHQMSEGFALCQVL